MWDTPTDGRFLILTNYWDVWWYRMQLMHSPPFISRPFSLKNDCNVWCWCITHEGISFSIFLTTYLWWDHRKCGQPIPWYLKCECGIGRSLISPSSIHWAIFLQDSMCNGTGALAMESFVCPKRNAIYKLNESYQLDLRSTEYAVTRVIRIEYSKYYMKWKIAPTIKRFIFALHSNQNPLYGEFLMHSSVSKISSTRDAVDKVHEITNHRIV